MTIYIADDDKQICMILERQLLSDGHDVCTYSHGKSLLDAFEERPCDLIVTDIMMPELDGYELCKAIRLLSDVPVMMLSAKGDEKDRIAGLEVGADDYLAKPVSLKELSLKVKSMLRRTVGHSPNSDGLLSYRDLSISLKSHQVSVGSVSMKVSEKEFQFLSMLLKDVVRSFSRPEIIEYLWGYDFIEDTKLLDSFVKRLRKKLAQASSDFEIETLWGYGYKAK